jgi:hypothetical protein
LFVRILMEPSLRSEKCGFLEPVRLRLTERDASPHLYLRIVRLHSSVLYHAVSTARLEKHTKPMVLHKFKFRAWNDPSALLEKLRDTN